MMELLYSFLAKLNYLVQKIRKTNRYNCTLKAKAYLQASDDSLLINDDEKDFFIKWLSHNLVSMFNYPFKNKYNFRWINVKLNKRTGLNYVITEDSRKLYFKRGMSSKKIISLYNSLCVEQDSLSPHNYRFNDFKMDSETVFADIGVAEGFFTLKYIDKIKKAYLFECEDSWVEALNATFEPWKEKIVIINKFVSNQNDDKFISLDNYFSDEEKPTLLKLDVEGYEYKVLSGAVDLLGENSLKDVLVCTYHNHEDADILSRFLSQKKFDIKFSPGYMLMIEEKTDDRVFDFRKGLIHASK